MSGGKGGSTSQGVQIPDWVRGPAERNLGRAERVAELDYIPSYGPDVAAPSPMLQSAWQGYSDQAAAFGLGPQGRDVMAGMPTPTTYAGGVTGYSSGDLYDQALAEFERRRPGQYAARSNLMTDPMTGDPSMYLQSQSRSPADVYFGTSQPVVDVSGDGGGATPVTDAQRYQNAVAFNNLVESSPVPSMVGGVLSALNEPFMESYADKMASSFDPGAEGGGDSMSGSGGSSFPESDDWL